jgi:CRISPR-associated protein Cas7/Cst2/DevR subtype I-B
MKYVHIYFLLEPGMNAANASGESDTSYQNSNLLKYYFYKKERLPYFSGQAYRRWLRDTMSELSGRDYSTIVDDLERTIFIEGKHYEVIKLKSKQKNKSKKDKNTYTLKKEMFEDFPGADIFGYMITAGGSDSIIRQSPTLNTFVLGLLPRQFIKDIVTKNTND